MSVSAASNVVLTVGPNGCDYLTINEALVYASTLPNPYSVFPSPGNVPPDPPPDDNAPVQVQPPQTPCITLELQPGYVMQEQVFIYENDLSHIEITAAASWDTTSDPVPIYADTLNWSPNVSNWRSNTAFAFCAMRDAGMPTLGALFEMQISPDGQAKGLTLQSQEVAGRCGMIVQEASHAVIERGFGIKNAPYRGLYIVNGVVYARQTVWDGAGTNPYNPSKGAGIRASNGSLLDCRQSSAKGCGIGLYAYSSRVSAQYCDFTDAVYREYQPTSASAGDSQETKVSAKVEGFGVLAGNSVTLSIQGCDCSGAGIAGVIADGAARITADGYYVNGSTEYLKCENVGAANAASSSAGALMMSNGAFIFAPNAKLHGSATDAIHASAGAHVVAPGADCWNAANRSIYANAATVEAGGAACTGAGADIAVEAYAGARVSIVSGKLSSAGSLVLKAATGSWISATGATNASGQLLTTDDMSPAPNSPCADGLILSDAGSPDGGVFRLQTADISSASKLGKEFWFARFIDWIITGRA